ncbi:MAG: ABC transporter ATP-binding protein [Methylobacterium sp.]|nr:ABC transporter ATP-binding protein [Methylobacterium sp.]
MLTALDGISFSIARGEILGLIGESGAGKSVAGAAIVGLIASPGRITGGTIHLAGERIDNLPEEKLNAIRGKRIGMIFQDPMTSLNPLIRIGDQLVETIRRHLGLSPKQARVRAIDLLAETGIPDPASRIDAYPHEFSGGMRQRVVIALALAGEPDLVIADEPTTALDVSVQAAIIALIEKLCRERGTAVLLITHDMGVIARATQRLAVMYAGRIIETGGTESILGDSRHPYTRGLMQAIPPLRARPRRLVQIPGAMPRLVAMPKGCAFHPRCAIAEEQCRQFRPNLVGGAHQAVACHLSRAFSEEVDTGSSKENSVNQGLRAVDLIESDRPPV